MITEGARAGACRPLATLCRPGTTPARTERCGWVAMRPLAAFS